MGGAKVAINKAADILAATFEESDEKCDRTESARRDLCWFVGMCRRWFYLGLMLF